MCPLANQLGIPARCLAQRNRQGRAVAMNDIVPKDEGNPQPALLEGNLLHDDFFRRRAAVEKRAPTATPDLRANLIIELARKCGLRHLPEFLFERHSRKE